MECIHFEAYVHVNAIMWRVVFRELRALTNGKGPDLSPIALNGLYEHMFEKDPCRCLKKVSDPGLIYI